jgi:hypothetical protein
VSAAGSAAAGVKAVTVHTVVARERVVSGLAYSVVATRRLDIDERTPFGGTLIAVIRTVSGRAALRLEPVGLRIDIDITGVDHREKLNVVKIVPFVYGACI